MEDKHLSSAGNYTDESIRTMEGIKHIRLRPGKFIGGLRMGQSPRAVIMRTLAKTSKAREMTRYECRCTL